MVKVAYSVSSLLHQSLLLLGSPALPSDALREGFASLGRAAPLTEGRDRDSWLLKINPLINAL
jgi:hypothetical protein